MGREAEKIYSSFQLATTVPSPTVGADAAAAAADTAAVPDADNFGLVMKRFDAYFIPKRNIIGVTVYINPRARKVSPVSATSRRERREFLQVPDGTVRDMRFQGQKREVSK